MPEMYKVSWIWIQVKVYYLTMLTWRILYITLTDWERLKCRQPFEVTGVLVVNYRDMMPEVCARNTSMTADLQVREINRHESRNDGHGESVQAIVFGESSVVRPVAIVTPRIRLTLQVNTPVEEPVEEDITDHLEAGYTPPDINNDEAVYTPPASDSEDGYTDEELEPPYITLLGGEEEYPNDLFIQYMQVKDTLVFALEDLGFSERHGGAPPLSVCSYTPCSGVLAHH
ncbi:uncharacterized protein LOC143485713 isoform X2 [Brachyhypopomus gauderio]|uniref:uncharacterized protein LOC143485713 isoform X2 n=1 Tax=Brachyhypopomus gauderio TaxID=698409 RepID=UPI0040418BAA